MAENAEESQPMKTNDVPKGGDDPEAALSADTDASKPSYQTTVVPIERKSLYRKCREVHQNAKNPLAGTKGVIDVVWDAVGYLILAAIHHIIPILMIVFGAIYIDKADCPADNIAILMLVGGVGLLVQAAFEAFRLFRSRRFDDDHPIDSFQRMLGAVSKLFALFVIAWTIASWVMVFRLWSDVSYNPEDSNYCHPVLMRFSFWIVILPFILIGVLLFLFCFIGLCFCILAVVAASND